MSEHHYPTVAEAVAIHRRLIERFGGALGIRDTNLLESAVFRPQSGYYESLFHEAAALMESLANNHPFVDGNKRIAFALTDTFLTLNGFRLAVDPIAANDFIRSAMARHEFRFPLILEWVRSHARPVESF